jgi:hypothetical protein
MNTLISSSSGRRFKCRVKVLRKIGKGRFALKFGYCSFNRVRLNGQSAFPGIGLVLHVIGTVRRIHIVHKVSLPAPLADHLRSKIRKFPISERHDKYGLSAGLEAFAHSAKSRRLSGHTLYAERTYSDTKFMPVIQVLYILEHEGQVVWRRMRLFSKLNHAFGIVYAYNMAARENSKYLQRVQRWI